MNIAEFNDLEPQANNNEAFYSVSKNSIEYWDVNADTERMILDNDSLLVLGSVDDSY